MRTQPFTGKVKNHMKNLRVVNVAVLLFVASCNPAYWYGAAIAVPLLAAAAHKEGDTIKLVSETSSAIVLAYTHTYETELGAVVRVAEARCQRFGKHARMNGSPQKQSLDRSIVSFDCVT